MEEEEGIGEVIVGHWWGPSGELGAVAAGSTVRGELSPGERTVKTRLARQIYLSHPVTGMLVATLPND